MPMCVPLRDDLLSVCDQAELRARKPPARRRLVRKLHLVARAADEERGGVDGDYDALRAVKAREAWAGAEDSDRVVEAAG